MGWLFHLGKAVGNARGLVLTFLDWQRTETCVVSSALFKPWLAITCVPERVTAVFTFVEKIKAFFSTLVPLLFRFHSRCESRNANMGSTRTRA